MPSRPQITILSGGQTGADRGALDAALDCGVRCGGWCPQERQAEDGAIPARYPVTPLPGADYAARTRRNVLDSDATVVVLFGPPLGGTRLTLDCCVEQGRPYLIIDAAEVDQRAAAERIAGFAADLPRGLLNVAGPRASEAPGAHDYVRGALTRALELLALPASRDETEGAATPLDESGPFPGAGPQFQLDLAARGRNSMARYCHSCAAPLEVPEFAGAAADYCRYCTTADGTLKSKKAIRKGIAKWMQSWQPELGDKEAAKRARRYMRSMPAWAD